MPGEDSLPLGPQRRLRQGRTNERSCWLSSETEWRHVVLVGLTDAIRLAQISLRLGGLAHVGVV